MMNFNESGNNTYQF